MSVFSDASEKQLDTTYRLDPFLVCVAFGDQVFGVSIQNIHLRWWDVN
jgi:hypothetical protein